MAERDKRVSEGVHHHRLQQAQPHKIHRRNRKSLFNFHFSIVVKISLNDFYHCMCVKIEVSRLFVTTFLMFALMQTHCTKESNTLCIVTELCKEEII